MADLKTICAWCGDTIKDGKLDRNGRASHGICAECYEAEIRDYKREILLNPVLPNPRGKMTRAVVAVIIAAAFGYLTGRTHEITIQRQADARRAALYSEGI